MRKRRLVSLILLALLLTPTVAQVEPRYKELPNFHRVNDQLYRGAQPGQGGIERLSQLGIKTVVNLRDNDDRAVAEEKQVRKVGLNYFNIPVGRLGRPEETDVQKVLAIINSPQNQPVFIHCKYGADRTGVMIGAYRILHDGWTSEQAKAEANRYGMKPWQIGMKDYLHDLSRQKQQQKSQTVPSVRRSSN